MGIISYDVLDTILQDIKKAAHETGGETVLIIVGPDCDAICSSRIFTALLKDDYIAYMVEPVKTHSDLQRVSESNREKDNLRSIVFFNCGAGIDLQDVFPALAEEEDTFNPNLKAYVIDSHRPLHLANVMSENSIFMVEDTIEARKLKKQVETLAYESDSGDDDTSDIYDSEEDNELAQERPRKRRRAVEEQTRRRIQRQEAREEYYMGSKHGHSAAFLMYRLATLNAKEKNREILWMAIVGVTDQLIHGRVTAEMYDENARSLAEELKRINGVSANDGEPELENGKLAQSDRINMEFDYRFMLFRHWSLYDSMFNTDYIANKLALWKEPGRERLNTLIAKMGIPLTEAKQKFNYMKSETRAQLNEHIDIFGSEFHLEDLRFLSFRRAFEFKHETSAADVVYGVTALLEEGEFSDDIPAEQEATPGEDNRISWKDAFWRAYDALSITSTNLLQEGLKRAISIQKAIIRQGMTLIESKTVWMYGSFRYVVLSETADAKLVNENQLALSKLANFLQGFCQLAPRKKPLKPKPFLIAAANSKSETYLITAINAEVNTKNDFGTLFAAAVGKTNAHVRHDGFDTNVIEVRRDDLLKFLNTLHSECKMDRRKVRV